jgi:hypothetical protein
MSFLANIVINSIKPINSSSVATSREDKEKILKSALSDIDNVQIKVLSPIKSRGVIDMKNLEVNYGGNRISKGKTELVRRIIGNDLNSLVAVSDIEKGVLLTKDLLKDKDQAEAEASSSAKALENNIWL